MSKAAHQTAAAIEQAVAAAITRELAPLIERLDRILARDARPADRPETRR